MDPVIIKKYLCGQKAFFLKPSHVFSLLGIIIGVTSLLIVSSVMNGFEQDMKRKIIGSKSEIRILSKDRQPIKDYEELLQRIDEMEITAKSSPVIQTELLTHKGESVQALNVIGIDFNRHSRLLALEDKIRLGYPDAESLENGGIIIGLELSLALRATVGEYIQLTSPISDQPTPFGLLPKMKKLKVIGVYSSDVPGYDKTHAFISLKEARYFAGFDKGVSSVQISTDKPHKSRQHAYLLREALGDRYVVEDWSQFDSSLFHAMRLEKHVMVIVLTLMLVISGFNMGGNSIKTVAEKKNEIGILKAIGMPSKRIEKIFLHTNLFLGLFGIIVGLFITLLFFYLQLKYRLVRIPIPGFPMEWLPIHLKMSDFTLVPLMVMVISALSTMIALRKIRNIEPIRIIRNLE